ncbi:MAG: hypothetical protein LBD53_06225 [Tannerella sp.]|jgi:hypothetical protein|nr:hypothetical protein [Tannerella sp.]
MKHRKFYLLSAALLLTGLFRLGLANAQNVEEVRRDFAVKDVTVNEMIDKLGTVYPHSFSVADKKAADVIKVSVNVKNATAQEVLLNAFSDKDLLFDNHVTITVSTSTYKFVVVATATEQGKQVSINTGGSMAKQIAYANGEQEQKHDNAEFLINCRCKDKKAPLILVAVLK